MKTAKKLLAILLASMFIFGCMAITSYAADEKPLDVAFVVDTTGSMEDDIAAVKATMKDDLAELQAKGVDFRIAIVDYRDFSSRTGSSGDYAYKVQLDFTNDAAKIINAINKLTLGNGGDWEETVYSALIDGLDRLSWRSGSTKSAILMGDAPALDPEPITGYTLDMAVNKLKYDETTVTPRASLFAAAPQAGTRSQIRLFTIATETDVDVVENFSALAKATGGKSYTVTEDMDAGDLVGEAIDDIVEPESFLTVLINFLFSFFFALLNAFLG